MKIIKKNIKFTSKNNCINKNDKDYNKNIPDDFNASQALNIITEIGKNIIMNGGEIFRADTSMRYIAKYFGLENFSVYVLTNCIFASAVVDGNLYSTKVKTVPISPINLCRVEALNALSRDIVQNKLSVDEIKEEISKIKVLEASNNITKILASGIGSFCFCYLFKGSFYDSFAAFFVGIVLYLFFIYVTPVLKLNRLINTISSSMLITVITYLICQVFAFLNPDRIIIGALFSQVPGIVLTSAVRNLMEDDYLSGIIRLMDALLMAVCIAIGVATGLRIITLIGFIL